MNKKAIIFFDSGDTLVDESTEIKDKFSIVQKAQLVNGAKETISKLFEMGYKLVLVADGDARSFLNIYSYHKIIHMFSAIIASKTIGVCKPSSLIFEAAMKALGLKCNDRKRIIMVGNNIERDIAGANNMGFISVLIDWSPRYRMYPRTSDEIPDFVISKPSELIEIVENFDRNI